MASVSKEEENEILDKYEKSGNLKDLEKLFLGNEGLIKQKVLKMYPIFSHLYDVDDMMQEIYLYLCQNIKYFDRSKGVRFSSYFLKSCISQRISMIIKQQHYISRSADKYINFSDCEMYTQLVYGDDTVFIDTVESSSLSPEQCAYNDELFIFIDEKVKTYSREIQEKLYDKFYEHPKISKNLTKVLDDLKEEKLCKKPYRKFSKKRGKIIKHNGDCKITTVKTKAKKLIEKHHKKNKVKSSSYNLNEFKNLIGTNKKVSSILRNTTKFSSISDAILLNFGDKNEL